MKEQKYHLYLSDDEYRQTIQSLVRLKNNLIAQGRYTDAVDDVLFIVLKTKRKVSQFQKVSEATSRTLRFLGLRLKSVSETLSEWTDT